jgi:hypothetical protein
MRNLIAVVFVSVFGFYAQAQSDTLQSGDDARPAGNDDIMPSFTFSQFTKVSKAGRYTVHGSGIFAGFSNLATRNLNIAEVDGAVLKYNSYEVGWTIVGMDIRLSKTHGWLFFSGLGVRVQQYNSDLNTVFKIVDDVTVQVPAPAGIVYSTSKLTQWYMHVPIMFEYQTKLPKTNFFAQLGFECGVKLSSKSKTMYRNDNENKTKGKAGTEMNVNPLAVDVKAEIGFGKQALYVRYGLVNLFRKGRGAEVVPVAAGVIFHF